MTKNIIDEDEDVEKNFEKKLEDVEKNLEVNNIYSSNLSIYLRDIRKYPLLNKTEEIELAEKIANGNEFAKEKLICSNLRLVVFIAKKFIDRGLSFEDLIQEGNIGLIRAVELFDITKGCKFSSYAYNWIKATITIGISDKNAMIHIPKNKKAILYKIFKEKNIIEQESGVTATSEEISRAANIDENLVKELLFITMVPTSLNSPIGEDENSSLSDLIDNGQRPIDNLISDIYAEEIIEIAKSVLSEREIDIFIKRYYNMGNEMTLEEIGNIYNISRERVRQIEAKLLGKLAEELKFKNIKFEKKYR